MSEIMAESNSSDIRVHYILSPLDAADLKANGLLVGAEVGSHRIHKRRLNRSSDEEYCHLPLTLPESPMSPEAHDAFVMIPLSLISEETLVFVGLSAERANELWSEWTRMSPDYAVFREGEPDNGGLELTFIDFIVGRTEVKGCDTDNSDTQWRECMDACGVSLDTQDAIMDTHFTDLRLSQSCMSWVIDTIEMCYAGLEDIQRASHAREIELRRMASRPGQQQHGRDQQGHRSISGVQQQGMPGIEKECWSNARGSVSGQQQQGTLGLPTATARYAAAENAPGYTVLYKGLDQARIKGLFDETGSLSDMGTLSSSSPSDFSPSRSLFYFSPDVHVAEYYARYVKRRKECLSAVIISLRIPNATVEKLRESEIRRILWPEDEWKELVWHCRNGKKRLPTHLRSYRDATLIIGHIARKPDHLYNALERWQDITEEFLLKLDGRKAIQYAISGDDNGIDWLEENAQDVKVYPYTKAELDKWIAESP